MVKRKTRSFELVNGELKLFISYFDISTQSLQYTYTIFNCFFANKKIFLFHRREQEISNNKCKFTAHIE